MKIGLYSPYFNGPMGGGERYLLTIAEHLSRKGHRVELFWEADNNIKVQAQEKLRLNLSRVKFTPNVFSARGNLLMRWWKSRQYDVIFYLSDGSIPFLFAKKNLIHFQVPFTGIGGRSFLNRIKLSLFKEIICNSYFTKRHIDQEFGVKSLVIYPPVSVEDLWPADTKRNIIISVGRFTQALHAKKQHVLIKVFKQMVDQGLNGWKLVLAGGTLPEDRPYIKKIKVLAVNYPIEILTDISFGDLKKYYGWAKIYWHAAGFGEDENLFPERMEHFGITTVESMAAGCVPVVINKGGQPEIVKPGTDGFLWGSDKELKKTTLQLIKSPSLLKKMSDLAIKNSQRFSKEVFCQKIDEIIA